MIDIAEPGEQGKHPRKPEHKPQPREELEKPKAEEGLKEEETAPELASAEEQSEGLVETQAEASNEEPATVEEAEMDLVAMERAGTGDEIKPQDFENETEVLDLHSRPPARGSSTRKGASRKGGARGGKKQTTPRGKRGQQQSGPQKGGQKSRSQTKTSRKD